MNTYPEWVSRSDCKSCSIFKDVLFSTLAKEDIDTIVDGIYEPIDQLAFKRGTILYHENNEDHAIYTIRSGLIKLVRYLPDGSERIMRLIKRADSIGLERLLNKPYGHTAIAIDDVSACRIPIDTIQRLNCQPRFYLGLMERWAASVFQADDYITSLLSGTVRQRIAHMIKWLASVTDTDVHGKHSVRLLSGRDMSAMIDISPESISRTLAELKRNDILRHIDGELYQYDPDRLESYAAVEDDASRRHSQGN